MGSRTRFSSGEHARGGGELGWASGTRSTLRNTGTPINRTFHFPTNTAGFPLTDPNKRLAQ